jgi:transposase InsO family protein
MSKARLVVLAVVLEGRSPAEVAVSYGVARSWVYALVARYRAEGDAALQPRSRRPHRSPRAIDQRSVELICQLRASLTAQGLDAGPATIAWHLATHHRLTISVSTIARTLTRHELIARQPRKRPKSSYVRFAAELPNGLWQTDFTHAALADGADTEILTFLDDHSRFALRICAHRRVTGPLVLAAWRAATSAHGVPAAMLSDNGVVFTARFVGGRNAFEHDLARLGVQQRNSRPGHPQTCGKVERFQQTLKNWLRAQPDQPATTDQLQALLDEFTEHYNTRRPHRSLHGRTPAAAYHALPKASPTEPAGSDYRLRHDKIDPTGKLTLRHAGRLHHIGISRTHAGDPVLMLIRDLHIRVVHAHTGELLRELTLNPTVDYQPTGAPRRRTP